MIIDNWQLLKMLQTPKISKIFCLVGFLLLFLSCSKRQITSNSSSTVRASSYGYESDNSSNSPQDPASDRFIVDPEIAVMSAIISSTASSFAEVIKILETNSEKLINSINNTQGCSTNIVDYHHPTVAKNRKYQGSIKLDIIISFAQKNTIQERIQKLNDCLRVISQLKLEDKHEDKNQRIYLSFSKVMPTIKNVGKYRKKLLDAKFTALKEVANFSQPASQFDALDTKCTSQGIVTIRDRSLSGIELDIDLDCRRLIDDRAIKIEKQDS